MKLRGTGEKVAEPRPEPRPEPTSEVKSELKIVRLLPEDLFLRRTADLHQLIAKQAYQLFQESGFADGHDLEHWLQAESQLLTPTRTEVRESQVAITVKTILFGFDAENIEIHVEPQRIFISGQQVDKSEASAEVKARVKRIFRSIDLPAQIDADKVRATFSRGELEIRLQKINVVPKADAASNNG
jgi:HSP20 family molecular chaperone IbpA